MLSTIEADLTRPGVSSAERDVGRALRNCDVDGCAAIAAASGSERAAIVATYGMLLHRRGSEARALVAALEERGLVEERNVIALEFFNVWLHLGLSVAVAEAACPDLCERAYAAGDDRLAEEIALMHAEIAHVQARNDDAQRRVKLIAGRTVDAIVTLRTVKLLALIDAANGDYERAFARELDNLALLEALPDRDVWYEGVTLRVLAALALDLDRFDVSLRVAARAESLSWKARHPLYWKALIHGSLVRSFWLHRGAPAAIYHLTRYGEEARVDPPLLIHAYTEASELSEALIALGHGDSDLPPRLRAVSAIERAATLAEQLDWKSVEENDQPFLLDLAARVARTDRPRGVALVKRFRAVRLERGGYAKWRIDEPLRLHERVATGKIEAALGRRLIATAKLAETVASYERIGFAWRAGDAALALAEVTRNAEDAACVAPYARRWPHSWIASRHAALVLWIEEAARSRAA